MEVAQGGRCDRAGLGCGEGILKFVEGDQGAHAWSEWGWIGARRKLFSVKREVSLCNSVHETAFVGGEA
jgi:hypothetical protein